MFRRYPEIENLYNSKKIKKFLEYHPSARESQYIFQVKYDGSNIQLIFEPDEYVQIAKRSGILPEGENFNGILDIIDRYRDLIEYFEEISSFTGKCFNLYGEIYGQGIQKRINYGPDKYIRFFDLAIDGEILPYRKVKEDYTYLVDNYYVETHGPVSFEEIFTLDVPEGHEGIVIKPYSLANENERQLRLKHKNEKFKEKGGKTKPKKEKDPVVEEMTGKFLPFITDNRVKSVFSKEGEIETEDQIGKYIPLVMEDALKDFEDEEDISHLSKNQLKQVKKNASKEIVNLLKEYL